jgi:hypothetical protein
VEVGEISGSLIEGSALAPLVRADGPVDRTRMYKVASTSYGIDRVREQIGRVESRRPAGKLRDLAVAHLRRHKQV